jgi:hypothetical protein
MLELPETKEHLTHELITAQIKLGHCMDVLELIATDQRADGTWNRDRKACQILARKTLDVLKL